MGVSQKISKEEIYAHMFSPRCRFLRCRLIGKKKAIFKLPPFEKMRRVIKAIIFHFMWQPTGSIVVLYVNHTRCTSISETLQSLIDHVKRLFFILIPSASESFLQPQIFAFFFFPCHIVLTYYFVGMLLILVTHTYSQHFKMNPSSHFSKLYGSFYSSKIYVS